MISKQILVDAGAAHARLHLIGAAHQDRLAHAGILEGGGGADHAIFLAFGKHHPLGLGAHRIGDHLEQAGGGIEPRRQLELIGVQVFDLLLGHAGLHRGFGHGGRHAADQARIEGRGDDIFRAIDRARAAIGGGDFIGHVFARQRRDGVGGGDLHLFIDGGGAHIQRAAEDVGKADDVVDLVGIVAAAGGDDHIVARRLGFFRGDFRIGIGHGEDDRVLGHRLDHLGRESALLGQPQDHVGALDRVFQGARLGFGGMRRLPLVHAFGAAAIDHALGVAEDDILGLHAHRLDQLQAGDAGRARAVHHHLQVFQLAAGQMRGVDDAGGAR